MARTLLAGAAAAVALATSITSLSANGVSAHPFNTWTTGGYVSTAVAGDGVVYLGGAFGSFGPRIGPMVAVDRATNEALPWPTFSDGFVIRILTDPAGGYLVQGTFQAVGGVPAPGIVRLTSTGERDSGFRWPTDVLPASAFIAADRLLVSVSTAAAPYFASALLDWRTGRVIAGPLPFNVTGAGTSPDGSLIAHIGTVGQSAIVQLNGTSGAIERTLYTPPAGQYISASHFTSTDVFLVAAGSGQFASPTGTVLRLDPLTGAATTLATVAGASLGRFTPAAVNTILLHQGRLFLIGNLTTLNGTPLPPGRTQMMALDAATGALTPWQRPDWAGTTFLAVDGGRLLFVSSPGLLPVAPIPSPSVYALDAATGAFTGWHLPLLASSFPNVAVVPEATRLLIGGQIAGIGAVERPNLAAVTLPNGRPTDWAPETAGTITNLALSGSRLFAVEGVTGPPRVVEFDTATGVRASWSAVATGPIRRMAVFGNRLFIVGPFTAIDGIPRNGTASFDLTASPPALESWTLPFAPSDVSALDMVSGVLLLGGAFPGPAGPAAQRLLAVDPMAGAVFPWYPAINERGSSASIDLATTAGRIFVSGLFDRVDDQPRPRVAAFDAGGRLLFWQVDDARDIATTTAMSRFEDRLYLTGVGLGRPLGIAFDLASGRRTDWVPKVDGASSGGRFLPVAGLGVLHYGYSSATNTAAAYAFYPRIPTLTAVTRLHGSLSGAQVQLAWDAAAGADSYVIEAGSGPGLANLALVDTQSGATTFSTAAPNGRYNVRVRPRNEGGIGPASNEVVIVVGPGGCAAAPDAPTNLVASASGLNATLSWLASPSGEAVSQYAIDLVTGPGSPATITRTTATTFSGTGPAGTYGVAVRAENACGSSSRSPSATLTLAATVR